jgi:heme-degrading monooxygenase HmoA
MFVVIFEVDPKQEQRDAYLGYAGQLKPELEKIDGFIDNERFGSRRRPGWMLSLSTWRDEKSLVRWRSFALHHAVQEKGRFEVFRDYHIRIGEVLADNQVPAGQVLREQRLDATETGAAKHVVLTERVLGAIPDAAPPAALAVELGAPAAERCTDPLAWDLYASLYRPGKFALLTSWRDAAAADAWPAPADRAARHRRIRVIRDYGMHDRAEAPQYYPPVDPARSH